MDEHEPEPLDTGATIRQIGLSESGNGFQNGILAVVIGLLIAAILYPIARLRRGR